MNKEDLRADIETEMPAFVGAVDLAKQSNIVDIQCNVEAFENADIFYKCMNYAVMCGLIVHILPPSFYYLLRPQGEGSN